MKNSKYVSSWLVQLLPNGVYQLTFNTTVKWVDYHRLNNRLYGFNLDESEEKESLIQEIPEFLPKDKNITWMSSHVQNKDQVTFYFIPFKINWLKEGKIKTIVVNDTI